MNSSNEIHKSLYMLFGDTLSNSCTLFLGNHLHGIPFASYTDGWGIHEFTVETVEINEPFANPAIGFPLFLF